MNFSYRIAATAAMVVAAFGVAAVGVSSHAHAAAAVSKDSNASKSKTPTTRGTLVVRATLLGQAKKPRVRVVGRGAPKRPVKLGTRMRLPAGTYTLISSPVKTARGTRYTASKRTKVRVRAKKITRATLRYRVLVPARTRVVPAAAARKITRVTGTSLRMPAVYAKALEKGSIITAGVTPATPDGLLRKVVSKSVKGGTATIRTAPATLREAVPEGEFSLTVSEDGSVSGSGLMERGGAESHASVTLSRTFAIGTGWGNGQRHGSCSFSGAGLRLSAQVTPKASTSLTASWPLFGSPELSVDSSLEVSGSASIVGEVAGSCSYTQRTPVHRFAAITVFAGPVPVVLTPALSAKAEMSIGSSLKASVGASFTARVSGGFTYKNGLRFRGSNTRELKPTTVSFGETGGNAKLTVSPEFSLLAYGSAGPKLSFSGGLSGTVRPTSNPWWWLDGHVGGNIGAKFSVLGWNLDAEHTIFERNWRIAEGTRPAPQPSSPATPPQSPTLPPATPPTVTPSRDPTASSLSGLSARIDGIVVTPSACDGRADLWGESMGHWRNVSASANGAWVIGGGLPAPAGHLNPASVVLRLSPAHRPSAIFFAVPARGPDGRVFELSGSAPFFNGAAWDMNCAGGAGPALGIGETREFGPPATTSVRTASERASGGLQVSEPWDRCASTRITRTASNTYSVTLTFRRGSLHPSGNMNNCA